jgi:hypothetical protein
VGDGRKNARVLAPPQSLLKRSQRLFRHSLLFVSATEPIIDTNKLLIKIPGFVKLLDRLVVVSLHE